MSHIATPRASTACVAFSDSDAVTTPSRSGDLVHPRRTESAMTHRTLTPVIGGFTFLEGPRGGDGRGGVVGFFTPQGIALGPAGEGEGDETRAPQPPRPGRGPPGP